MTRRRASASRKPADILLGAGVGHCDLSAFEGDVVGRIHINTLYSGGRAEYPRPPSKRYAGICMKTGSGLGEAENRCSQLITDHAFLGRHER